MNRQKSEKMTSASYLLLVNNHSETRNQSFIKFLIQIIQNLKKKEINSKR